MNSNLRIAAIVAIVAALSACANHKAFLNSSTGFGEMELEMTNGETFSPRYKFLGYGSSDTMYFPKGKMKLTRKYDLSGNCVEKIIECENSQDYVPESGVKVESADQKTDSPRAEK